MQIFILIFATSPVLNGALNDGIGRVGDYCPLVVAGTKNCNRQSEDKSLGRLPFPKVHCRFDFEPKFEPLDMVP